VEERVGPQAPDETPRWRRRRRDRNSSCTRRPLALRRARQEIARVIKCKTHANAAGEKRAARCGTGRAHVRNMQGTRQEQARHTSGTVQHMEGSRSAFDNDATPRATHTQRVVGELADTGDSAKRFPSSRARILAHRDHPIQASAMSYGRHPPPIQNSHMETIRLSGHDRSFLHRLRCCAAGFETGSETMLGELKPTFPDDLDLPHSVSYRSEFERSKGRQRPTPVGYPLHHFGRQRLLAAERG